MLAITLVRSTKMCAAHQEDLLCCHILHLCERHHGPSTTPIRNILLSVLWSCPYIRKSAKVVHISRLGSYRFRYLNTHSTSPTSLCSTMRTHHLLGRNERHTGQERMFRRFARVQGASSLLCSTASASKMHMKLTFRRRPPRLIGSVHRMDHNSRCTRH